MTREEAVERLNAIKQFIGYDKDSEIVEATQKSIDMAIKALEQEPKTIQEKQAESEKYDKAFDDGYRNGYAQARFDYEQEPKTGHWIAQDIHNCHTDFKCSECGYIHSFMHLYGKPTADYTYCPHCGAKMVEPQESEEV